jgi:hypothetical protein
MFGNIIPAVAWNASSLALFGRGQGAVSPAALPNSPDFTKVNWPNLPFFLTFLRAYLLLTERA